MAKRRTKRSVRSKKTRNHYGIDGQRKMFAKEKGDHYAVPMTGGQSLQERGERGEGKKESDINLTTYTTSEGGDSLSHAKKRGGLKRSSKVGERWRHDPPGYVRKY